MTLPSSSAPSSSCFANKLTTNGKKRKFSSDSTSSSSLVSTCTSAATQQGKLAKTVPDNISDYLEGIYSKYQHPPTWILATLEKHLNIEMQVLNTSKPLEHFLSGLIKGPFDLSLPQSLSLSSSTANDFSSHSPQDSSVPLSLDTISQLVSRNLSRDVNNLLLERYNQSMNYLTLSMFRHDVITADGYVDLDEEVRHHHAMERNYTPNGAQIIEALYSRVCELESHVVFMSIQEYHNNLHLKQSTKYMEQNFPMQTIVSSIKDETNWKKLQQDSCMHSSADDLYAEHGVINNYDLLDNSFSAHTLQSSELDALADTIQNSLDTNIDVSTVNDLTWIS